MASTVTAQDWIEIRISSEVDTGTVLASRESEGWLALELIAPEPCDSCAPVEGIFPTKTRKGSD